MGKLFQRVLPSLGKCPNFRSWMFFPLNCEQLALSGTGNGKGQQPKLLENSGCLSFLSKSTAAKSLKLTMFNTQSVLSQLLHRCVSVCICYCSGVPLTYTIVNCLGKNSQNISSQLFYSAENQYAESCLVLYKPSLLHWHYSQLSLLWLQGESDLFMLSHFKWSSLIFLALVWFSQLVQLLLQKKSDNLQAFIWM